MVSFMESVLDVVMVQIDLEGKNTKNLRLTIPIHIARFFLLCKSAEWMCFMDGFSLILMLEWLTHVDWINVYTHISIHQCVAGRLILLNLNQATAFFRIVLSNWLVWRFDLLRILSLNFVQRTNERTNVRAHTYTYKTGLRLMKKETAHFRYISNADALLNFRLDNRESFVMWAFFKAKQNETKRKTPNWKANSCLWCIRISLGFIWSMAMNVQNFSGNVSVRCKCVTFVL